MPFLLTTRLYHLARLIHADLSEYNLLICPHWQASHDHLILSEKRTEDDEALEVVMIDFGQAVSTDHPSAAAWLKRDLSTVRDFFIRQGITTLSNEEAEAFVTDPHEEAEANEAETNLRNNWRHTKRGWDDRKNTEVLLKKLKEV